MTDSTSPNGIVHLNGLENPEAGTSGFFYFWSFFFKKIARGRVNAPLTIVRPSQIRTCGFSASGSLRNELFTLSFIYTDIDPRSYQRIAVIWSYVKKKYKLRMTFFHLASILSRQVFAPALIVYSCIVFHTHQAKDIHNDYESLLYYKMSLCTQKQGGMHVYNQIF